MKRSHDDFREEEIPPPGAGGVAATLRRIQDGDDDRSSQSGGNDWQLVARKSKKPKKIGSQKQKQKSEKSEKSEKSNRPALTFAPLHTLNSMIRISDLQNLVLYCLADGFGPQWVSVRHHGQIRKAVVLMIPGLESGMLNGDIELERSDAKPVSIEVPGVASHHSIATPGLTSEPPIEDHDHSIHRAHDHTTSYTIESQAKHTANATASGQPSDVECVAPLPVRKSANRNPDDFLPVTLTADTLPVSLKPLADIFDHMWPVKGPGDDKYYKLHSPLHAMLTAPITKSQEEKKADKNFKGPKPVARSAESSKNQRTRIVEYISSNEDRLENDYVLHPASFGTEDEKAEYSERRVAAKTAEDDGWRDTIVMSLDECTVPDSEVEKGSVTCGRTVLAIDCEMCTVEGGDSALTRISIVAWDGEVIMDEFVQPDQPVIDYLTPYSGITAKSLEGVTTTLSDIQTKLLSLFHPRTILIGHSLDSDLKALKMTHPFIIDTSIIFPHPRGPPLKSSLKWLAQKYLSREIQKGHGTSGHDSIEDARACLDLVKQKCEKGPKWGTTEASGESIFKRLLRAPRAGSFPREGKTGAIVDRGAPERNFGSMAGFCIGCKDDDDVVTGVKRAVAGDADGAYIPGGGVEFTWARMQELAIARNWVNDNRTSPSSSGDPAQRADPSAVELDAVVRATVNRVVEIWKELLPCTLFVVYSGTGDPREMARLQEVQRVFKREYRVKKWDELSVRWTDVEEQALKSACKRAREGVGFVALK